MAWESAERVQKNSAGQYRALIGGEWVPVTRAQKSSTGEYRVEREAAPVAAEPTSEIPQRTLLGAIGESAGSAIPSIASQIGSLADIGGQLVESAMRVRPRIPFLETGPQIPPGESEFPKFMTDLAEIGGGFIAKAIPERFIKDPEAAKQLIAKADAFGGGMKQRYGSYQALLNTIATDPAGFAADVSTLFGGVAAGARRVGAAESIVRPLETTARVTDPISALAPVVAATAKGGARVAGATVDLAKNRLAELQAAKIMRGAAGNQLPAILAATGAAPEGITAGQAAYGINAPEFQALEAAAREVDPAGFAAIANLQGQERIDALARLAGGYTSAQSRAAQEAEKASLAGLTGPMREQALAQANRPGRVMPRLRDIAAGAREAASTAVENVRRLTSAVNKADDWARNWVTQSQLVEGPDGTFTRQYIAGRGVGEPGVRLPGRVEATATYPGQLAASGRQTTVGGPFERQVIDEGGVVARRIDQEAAASLAAGQKARRAEELLAQISEQGLVPLQTEQMIASLQAKLRNPRLALNDKTSKSLERVSEMLRDWTNENGVITAEALAAIREYGINSVIEDLMPQASAKARRKATQSVMIELKPMIDDAMKAAGGGDDWANYLRTFEAGMKGIERRRMAQRALELFGQNPAEYVKLIEGNNVKAVEKIFGPGKFDIAKEMGTDFGALRDVAFGVKRDIELAEQATAGTAALKDLIIESGSSFRLPSFLSAKAAITNKVLEGVESYLSAKSLKIIAEAMKSGKSANQLLQALPTADRSTILLAMQDVPEVQAAVKKAAPTLTAISAVEQKTENLPDVTVERIGNRLIDPTLLRQFNSNALRP